MIRQCIAYLVVFFLFYTSTEAAFPASNPSKALAQIPKEDYAALDQLFRCLIFENYFAYTLFGSKPMTYHGAFYRQPFIRPWYKAIPQSNSKSIFLSNWKIWEKYSKLPDFKIHNFLFIEEKRPELFGVHFLSKKNVLQCVRDNLKTFQEELEVNITPEKVLQSLTTSKDLYETLNDSQILYGILFGFGAENARAFYQKFDLGLPLPDPTSFHNEDPELRLLPLPYFVVFYPNKETEKLRKQYLQDREKILDIYSAGNFLEITFTQLLSND